MARIKEMSLCENGDFDIKLSFSKEDIAKIGIDSRYHVSRQADIISVIWEHLKDEIREDDRRTLGL